MITKLTYTKSMIIKKPINLASMNKICTNIKIILNREENRLNTSDSHIEIDFDVIDNAALKLQIMLIVDWSNILWWHCSIQLKFKIGELKQQKN